TSAGERIANPRHVERKACSLARYQRRLARCQKGSANRAKAAAKVARAHRKVRNARRDFLHRASTSLVRSADLPVIEDLALRHAGGSARSPGPPGQDWGGEGTPSGAPRGGPAGEKGPRPAGGGIFPPPGEN